MREMILQRSWRLEMYEALLTQKSLSNQAAFCWSVWQFV